MPLCTTVVRPSLRDRNGLFADKDIAAGSIVATFENLVQVDEVCHPYAWRGDDGVPWCPADALHCKPDPTMPGNGSFLNDSIDLDSVVRCIRNNELGEAVRLSIGFSNTVSVYTAGKPTHCVALEDIPKDHELTLAYGSMYWLAHIMNRVDMEPVLRWRALRLHTTTIGDSGGRIPVRNAVWYDLNGDLNHTTDVDFDAIKYDKVAVYKRIVRTVVECIRYLKFKADRAVKADIARTLLQAWKKLDQPSALISADQAIAWAALGSD